MLAILFIIEGSILKLNFAHFIEFILKRKLFLIQD